MFAPIQNVVSTRDLFNSNPCRDFWDSQQFSQAASGSQHSQSSSLELLSSQSQPKSSQQNQKHDSNYDGCYAGISQKANEDEQVKYYMKYLSKPPLFSDQNKHENEKGQADCFKEFIEAQKIKAIERDQRELLDSFIGLLKDYTKEVQSAMESFKDSLDSSMATNNTNADKLTSAAEKSFHMVDELKEDFNSNFNKLRNDLKENENLKALLSKKEQDLLKLDMEIQLQKKQIEELKRNEADAHKREEDFKHREEKLLEKIKEAEQRTSVLRDTPPSTQEPCDVVRAFHQNPRNNMKTVPSQPIEQGAGDSFPMPAKCSINKNHFPSSRIDYPRFNGNPGVHSSCAQLYGGSDQHGIGTSNVYLPTRCNEYSNSLQRSQAHPLSLSTCPTASIAPVQMSKSQPQCPPTTTYSHIEKQKPTSPSAVLSLTDVQEVNHQAPRVTSTLMLAPSPASRVSLIDKSKLPKKSPVATVLPQIQCISKEFKQSEISNQPRKEHQHDPSGIFMFDLTTSPQFVQSTSSHRHQLDTPIKKERPESPLENLQPKIQKKSKKFEGKTTRKYATRSRSKLDTNAEIDDQGPCKQSEHHPDKCQAPSVNLKRKVYKSVASQNKKQCSKDLSSSTRKSDDRANVNSLLETGDKNDLAKVSRSNEENQKTIRRQRAEQRTIDLSGSSLFEIIDEEISIQQIANSIRKHAQKRRMKQKSL